MVRECLLLKHKDPSSDPQHPLKARYGCGCLLLQLGGRRQANIGALWPTSEFSQLGFSERFCLKVRWEGDFDL